MWKTTLKKVLGAAGYLSESLRRLGQWLGQFHDHYKTGIAWMIKWIMAAGIGLFHCVQTCKLVNRAHLSSSGISLSVCILAFSGLLFGFNAQAVQTYTLTDLGSLGEVSNTGDDVASEAVGINKHGQVVGVSYTSDSIDGAFIWSAGSGMTNIGYGRGIGGINDNGQVAMTVDSHASVWSVGSAITNIIDLGTLGGVYSGATAINNNGQVVGWSDMPVGYSLTHAFLWSADTGMIDLGDNTITASAINDKGTVVGRASSGHAFIWSAGSGVTDLGTLAGVTISDATGINASNQVVGGSNNSYAAFLWNASSGMVNLDTTSNAYASGINDSGQVVGWTLTEPGFDPTSGTLTPATYHAFLWTSGTGMVDLNCRLSANPNGFELKFATAINSVGQIVGNGTVDGQTRAFLLTPTSNQIPVARSGCAIPQPPTPTLSYNDVKAALGSATKESGGKFIPFDATYFVNTYSASLVGYAGDALQYYVEQGAMKGFKPTPWFNTDYYRAKYPGLQTLYGADLLAQYALFGVNEGRSPSPALNDFDGARYLAENPGVNAYVQASLKDFKTFDPATGQPVSDAQAATQGAIAHYIKFGAAEGRVVYDTNGVRIVLDANN